MNTEKYTRLYDLLNEAVEHNHASPTRQPTGMCLWPLPAWRTSGEPVVRDPDDWAAVAADVKASEPEWNR